METTDTPGYELAVRAACVMLLLKLLFASTSTMLARGAAACAHSTSMAVSSAGELFATADAVGSVVPPVWLITLKVGSPFLPSRSGRPRFEENCATSFAMLGLSKEPTMA